MELCIKLEWTFVILCGISVFSIMLFDDYASEIVLKILKGCGLFFGFAVIVCALIGLWSI